MKGVRGREAVVLVFKKSSIFLSLCFWAHLVIASDFSSSVPLIINEAGALITSSDPIGCVPAIIENHFGRFASPAKLVWSHIADNSMEEQVRSIYQLATWDPNKKPDESGFKGLIAGIRSIEKRKFVFEQLLRGVDLSRVSCFDYFYHLPESESKITYKSSTELRKVNVVGQRKVIITLSNVVSKENIDLVEASKKNDGINVEALQFYIESGDEVFIDSKVHLGTENLVGAEESAFSSVWSFLGALSDLNLTKIIDSFRSSRDLSRAGGNTVDRAKAALGEYYRSHPGRIATRINMMHTHPHDAVKIVFADGKTQLIYPEVSREDLDALVATEKELGVPVKVTAIIGVSHDTLSLMSIHLAPQDSVETP